MDVDSKDNGTQVATTPDVARTGTHPAPLGTIPTQRSRTGLAGAGGGRTRRTWFVVAGGLALVMAGATTGVAAQQAAAAREEQRAEARLRVSSVLPVAAQDVRVAGALDSQAVSAVYGATRAAAAASAQQTVDQANATLAASPQAGDAPLVALQGAAGAVSTAIAGPNVSVAALRTAAAGVAAPQQAVVDAQAAWVAAEQARIAAEQAAAAEAARQAAARAATKTTVRPKTSRGTTTSPQPSGGSAPAAPAPGGVPAGGKVCQGSGGAASEASAGAIGDAINAYRSANGLGTLSVSRSGGLTSHALDMAATGGIWHSGSDNIVGCVSNGSASSLVSAWSNSSGHNAQMLRTDVSSMSVGAGSSAGWLFGAVRFS
ncbi:CAP domain-containing protein [Cellulomonas biazotea]|uniref:CAP domain-containing protein n=2 Tax=Cellulomonas biazotea TaxID=1709 RepID=UPI0035E8D812